MLTAPSVKTEYAPKRQHHLDTLRKALPCKTTMITTPSCLKSAAWERRLSPKSSTDNFGAMALRLRTHHTRDELNEQRKETMEAASELTALKTKPMNLAPLTTRPFTAFACRTREAAEKERAPSHSVRSGSEKHPSVHSHPSSPDSP